jgi:ADP-ribosylglycohydrolase
MLGAVAGDIIGSPYEWNNTDDRYFDLCHSTRGWYRGREVSFHPKFTDDTVMTLAVAKWLMDDKERRSSTLVRIMRDMAREYPDRGYGPMFRRWFEGDDQKPANSYGNGCAMRVSPVGLVAQTLPEALDLARQTAEVSHMHPEGIKGAQAIAEAVWMAKHGRTKDDIRFAMESDFGYDLGQKEEDFIPLLHGCVKEPVIVNGEETGGFYFRETGKYNSSCQDTVPAALMAFLRGDSFEDVVRRAVAMGGDSDTICSMAGAIAEPFYSGVPEKIRGLCDVYLDPKLRELMETFERVEIRKEVRTGKIEKGTDDAFRMIKIGDEKSAYIVSAYRKEIISALKQKFGEDIEIIAPRAVEEYISKNYAHEVPGGTYVEPPLIDIRTIFYKDGVFYSPTTYPYPDGVPVDTRKQVFSDFLKMKEYARDVKSRLQNGAGYHGEGDVHFATAYFPVIYHSSIEVWKGDTFAGAIGIDPMSGVLKVKEGGDIGPMEWGEDRCFSVFSGTSLDSVKESLSFWCLDEGVGIGTKSPMLNTDRAFNDISASLDPEIDRGCEKQAGLKK